MAKTLAVNEKNDLYIDQTGNIAVVFGAEAISQACVQSAKSQRGEMIFDINRGLPNFQTIWATGSKNIPQWEAALRTIILSNENVIAIRQFQIAQNENNLTYRALIETTFGLGLING